MDEFTYSKAGVDIDKEKNVVDTILKVVGFKEDAVIIDGIKLVLCTDGVGSKVIVANEMKKWDTIGIDCIAMNVNDALVMGAKPVAFVDYLAMEKTNQFLAEEISKGLKQGSDQAGTVIIGGETATLPEIINGFDLAGTCLGVVEKELPKDIKKGDIILGIKSSGIHSNGYTLARKIFTENGYTYHDEIEEIGIIGDALLVPTQIYVNDILKLWQNIEVKGIIHITGSGLRKISRLSNNFCFNIDEPINPQLIFTVMQKLGNISDEEMYQTFNMGMGMVIIVDKEDVDESLHILNKYNEAQIVGNVIGGKGVKIPQLRVTF